MSMIVKIHTASASMSIYTRVYYTHILLLISCRVCIGIPFTDTHYTFPIVFGYTTFMLNVHTWVCNGAYVESVFSRGFNNKSNNTKHLNRLIYLLMNGYMGFIKHIHWMISVYWSRAYTLTRISNMSQRNQMVLCVEGKKSFLSVFVVIAHAHFFFFFCLYYRTDPRHAE